MTTQNIIILLIVTFFADQVLQPKSVQLQKGVSPAMLLVHVLFYSIPITVYAGIIAYKTGSNLFLYSFPVCCMAAHFIIELPTSRIISRLYAKGQKRVALIVHTIEYTALMIAVVLIFDKLI
jgi:hypothetical protein